MDELNREEIETYTNSHLAAALRNIGLLSRAGAFVPPVSGSTTK